MKNYNYYDKLTKEYNDSLSVLSGGSSAPVKRKSEHQKEMAAYHNKTSPAANDVTPKQKKSSFEQWNIEKTQPKLSYGIGRYAEPYTPPEVDNAVLKGYNKPTGEKGLPDISTDAFKQKAQNQWYNKITHGSFKEDDWFGGMVKNQQNAESWYKSTYGENEGKKEYDNLHSRLIYTPIDKIKEEEKQFVNYKASDFKVPEIQPVKYRYSSTSEENKDEGKKEKATKVVKENADYIKQASIKYGVDPLILTACIYGEQAKNVNFTDFFDLIRRDSKASLGVAQVQIGTAIALDDSGYIPEPIQYLGKTEDWHGNGTIKSDMWYIPGYGKFVGNRNEAMHVRLSMPGQSIEYAAAYLAQMSDAWREEYPQIDTDVGILTTLYNIGYRKPHANPKNGAFGDFVMNNYEYIKYLTDTYIVK